MQPFPTPFAAIPRRALSTALLLPVLGAALPATARGETDTEARGAVADGILVLGEREHDALTTANATGSRLGLTPLETPASIAVLDGDAIRARGDMSIVEAESRAPGVSSVATLGNGGTALAARGFSGQGSVLQLIDGVRLFPGAGTITFPTDPWMVESIDLLGGPASVLYGQGALGGAVNVLMRKPNSQRTEGQAEIGYGSQNSFHAAAGLGGPLSPRLSYRVDASYRRSDGYVDRGGSHSLALSGTLRWAPTDTLSVTLRDDWSNNHPSRYFGTPLIDGKLDTSIRHRNYNVGDAAVRFRDNRTTLRVDWAVSDALTFSNSAYRLTTRRHWRNLESYCWVGADGFCPSGANATAATPGTIYRTDNLGIGHDQTQWGDTGSLTLRTPVASGIANALVLGFDANTIRFVHSNDFGSTVQESTVDPWTVDPGLFLDTQGIAPRYRTRTREIAFFAEDRLTLGDHVSIVGGLRYERNRVRRWSIAYDDEGRRTDSFALDKRLHNTTWRVGGVYQPVPTVSLYAQYATGVDPLGSLTTYSTGQVAFSHATGDQVEVGAKAGFLNGRGTATLAAYRIVKKHLLAQQTLTSPVEQVGQRSAKGLEASVSLDLPHGLGLEANGALLDARFDDFLSGGVSYTGNTPPNIPERMANLWLRWAVTSRLQTRAGLRYVGRRFSDNANRFRIPGYATVDASLSYALTPRLALDIHVYNLLDKAYAITSYNDEQWILGRPRSVDVSLRAGF